MMAPARIDDLRAMAWSDGHVGEPVEGLGVYDTRARGRGARRPARSAGIGAPQLQVDAMERKQQ